MFESVPTYPVISIKKPNSLGINEISSYGGNVDRFWDIVERHKVTQFYTAPTAIRALMRYGDEPVNKHDLSSLRVLGTVGEPIDYVIYT